MTSKLSIPYVNQTDSDANQLLNDCGIACVAMLAQANGQAVTVDDMVTTDPGDPIIPDSDALISVETIRQLCGAYGMEAKRETALDAEDVRVLIDQRRPPILLVDYGKLPERWKSGAFGHFVLAVGYNEDAIIIHDPYWPDDDGAFIMYTDAELAACWSHGWGSSGNYYNGLAIVPVAPVMADSKRSLYGVQWFLGPSSSLMGRIAESKPAIVKAVGGADKLWDVQRVSPNSILIGREFLGAGIGDDFRQLYRHVGGDTTAMALYETQQLEWRYNQAPPETIWESIANEFFPTPEEDPKDAYRTYSAYCIAYMQAMERMGRKAAVCLFPCGNPGLDHYEYVAGVVDYAHRHGHWIGLHEYFNLTAWHLWGPNQDKLYKTQAVPMPIANPPGLKAGYLTGRWLYALAKWGYADIDDETLEITNLSADLPNIYIGEFGQDRLGSVGIFRDYYGFPEPWHWQSEGAVQGWSKMYGLLPIDGYMQSVAWYDDLAHAGGLKGICWYIDNGGGEWSGFNLTDPLLDRIFQHVKTYSYTGLTPEEGGEMADREIHYSAIENAVAALRALDGAIVPSSYTHSATVSLNLRASATISAAILKVIPAGGKVRWLNVSMTAGGIVWYKVEYNDLAGWCASQYLAPLA